jgi:hypothetical protein
MKPFFGTLAGLCLLMGLIGWKLIHDPFGAAVCLVLAIVCVVAANLGEMP